MREADIRPPEILAEYLRLSAADARAFFAGPSARSHRACPGCAADRPVPAFEKNGFALVRCGECATLYVDPAPSGPSLDAFYRDSPSSAYWARVFFPTVAEARREKIFRPRVRRILDILDRLDGPRDSVIDVGAGAAIFAEEFAAAVPDTELRAVEPGAALAATCRTKGFETFEGFADDAARTDGWRDSADLVTCFEVIEHVADVDAFVGALGRLARPGGLVLLSGLCGDGFDIETLGPASNAVSPPHHLTFLSRKGVEHLLHRCGLELAEFSTPGQLDVDIVCNALEQDSNAVADPELRAFLESAGPGEREELQARLVAEGRSSHMWILAARPEAA